MSNEYTFGTVQDAILALQKGEFVVVMDDEDRENEGDLIIAAELITPEKMALLIRHTSGIICTPMTQDRATLLELPPMIQNNTDPKQTAFTVSCDVEGTSTGVSAADRTLTCRALANPYAKAGQFRKPGHIFPLVAKSGGVLERRGHTEAAVDMCKLAGLTPVGVIGEIANEDGTMSRLKECHALAKQYGFVLTTVEAIVKHRELLAEAEAEAERKAQQIPPPQLLEQSQSTPVQSPPQTQTQGRSVELLAECELPIQRANKYLGIWTMRCYRSYPDGHSRHIALIKGNVAAANGPVLVRVHSECFTSHVIGSCRCDCSQQFDVALEIINNAGCGVALYVDGHEGRGIGLDKKIQAYALQQQKQVDTYTANELLNFPVDMRSYAAPRAILEHIGLNKINIISNNPTKVKEFDDIVNAIVPVICEPNEHNSDYLRAKRSYERKHSIHSASFQAALSRSSTTSPHLTQEPTAPTIASSTPTVALESSIVDNTQSVKEPADPHLSKEIPIHLPSLENIAGLRIGVIRTSWNETLVGSLHTKCIKALTEYGVHSDNIVREFDVPGSFELPFAAQSLAQSGQVDAVICFGVLIKGETMHFEYISNAVSQGLMQVQLNTGIPVVYGVLNCLTLEQAAVRCGTTGDSILPQSLAATAIRMASLKKGQNVNHSLTKPMMQPCALG